MSDLPTHPFWDFSLNLYGQPGVADACLALQDELGADVNVVLFACFAATQGVELSTQDIRNLDAAVSPWRDRVVLPLRELRRRLKGGVASVAQGQSDTVRKRIAASEIQAEHVEQLALAGALPIAPITDLGSHKDIARRAIANLDVYFKCFGMAVSEKQRGDVTHMVAVASQLTQ